LSEIRPYTLVAELTYRCPLRCPYCSNPIEWAKRKNELDTETWLRVFREAEDLGVVGLNLTGGEPVLRREFARSVDFIRHYRTDGRLLELGCAYGFFLMEAARHFDVAGIELAEEAAEHCRRAGLNVVQGAADEANLAKVGHVDVIVLFDVIEHLPDPRRTLALCHQHLNPGGVIVITTGDFGSAIARLAGVKWRLMTPPQHLWFFTQESFRRLASALGLAVEHVDHPWKIVPASLIAFQLRRMLGLRGAGVATASRLGVPVNLFDAMRIVLRKARR